MARRLRVFAVTILTTCLVLVGLPAVALEYADDYIDLPFGTYSDMLVDPAQGQVFVTGGSGTNEVAVVKLDGSGTTTVPGLPGAAKMTMSEDGGFIYVVLLEGDGIAEIDTATLAARRIDTGAASCPSDVAAVGGYVWFLGSMSETSCYSRGLRRLDPVSGEVADEIYAGHLDTESLHALPGGHRLLYAETRSSTVARIYDVTDGVATQETAVVLETSRSLPPRLTDDGAHLMVDLLEQVAYYRTSDLAADGVTPLASRDYLTAFQAGSDILATADQDPGSFVELVRRTNGGPLNSIALGPTDPGRVLEIAMVGDQMLVLTSRDRLYQVDRPTVPAPTLTLQVPAESPVGLPVTASGVLTDGDAAIAGAGITLRRADREGSLGAATTDAEGRYAIEIVPEEIGALALSVHYGGDARRKPATGKGSTDVVRRPVALTVSGPATVWPDENVTLTGTLHDRGEPFAGVTLGIERSCAGRHGWQAVETVVTDAEGRFTSSTAVPATYAPGSCSSPEKYDYRVRYFGDDLRTPSSAVVPVEVTWVQPYLVLSMRPWVYVDEPVDVKGRLTADGSPMADESIDLHVNTADGQRGLGTVTTDADGRFTLEDVPPVEGDYSYVAWYAGNSRTRPRTDSSPVQVVKRPSEVALSGPESGDVDKRVVLPGRLTSDGTGVPGAKVLVSRADDYAGTQDLAPVTTAADGTFVVRDFPPRGGGVTYVVSYPGSTSREPASASFLVPVRKRTQELTLRPDRRLYRFGQTARVTIGPVMDFDRKVRVYAKENGRDKTLVFSGTVPSAGLTIQHRMKRNTVFSARTPETGQALAASTSVARKTRAGLTTSTPRPRAVLDGYKLYRPASQPVFKTQVRDLRGSGCVYFQIQQKRAQWKTVATTSCRRISDASIAYWKPRPWLENRSAYRVRPTFRGDAVNAASKGSWIYLKFA